MAGQKRKWLGEVSAYTLAGGLVSGMMGAVFGTVGGLLMPGKVGPLETSLVFGVGAAALARELRWVRFPIPQWKRQTRDYWAKVFPGVVAAMLWGLDLGFTLTTRLTFSGVWLLVVAAIAIGDPWFAGALLVAYWLGRALSVWMAPLLMPDAMATPDVLDAIDSHSRLFRRAHVVGLIWSIVVLMIVFVSDSGL